MRFRSGFILALLQLLFHISDAFVLRSSNSLSMNTIQGMTKRERMGKRVTLPLTGHVSSDQNSEDADVLDSMSEERKANLFQFLLRDLQVEGVPLLAVDSNQVHTLQAAIWTTLAELSEQKEGQKVCLVFEDIPIPAIRSFVDDFMILKTQDRLLQQLPELRRVNLSLVGKGVGPAVVIETTAGNSDSITQPISQGPADDAKYSAALKMFIDRMAVDKRACPHAAGAVGEPEFPTGYRVCGYSDASHVLSSFWNCICELLVTPSTQLGTTMLSLPGVDSHARFEALSELVSRSLCLYRGDDVFELYHFHPDYDRDLVHPIDKPAFGHLPPLAWLRPMLRKANLPEADTLSDDDLKLSNFLRRAPTTAICIKRTELLDAVSTTESGIVELNLDNGQTVQASGIPTYAQNAVRLAMDGAETLGKEREKEMSIVR